MTVLVDSDILIEVSRGGNEAILSEWGSLCESRVVILYSPVSAAELWAGARRDEYEATAQLFLSLDCAPIDHSIGEMAGEFMRRYAKTHDLKLGDALIAATATKNRAQLWTRNRKHFPMPEVSFH
jgi:predicted nucleic acid-binding protein